MRSRRKPLDLKGTRALSARLAYLGVAIALSLAVAACGDDEPGLLGPGDQTFEGTYTATISGAATQTVSGTAIFAKGTDPESGQQGWIVYLPTDVQNPLVAGNNVLFVGLGEPESRAYTLEDIHSGPEEFPNGGAAGMVLLYDGQNFTGAFNSTGGTLTVTSVSDTRMDGSFNFTAEGFTFDGTNQPQEGTVNVQGTFQAEGGTFLNPFGSGG